MSPRYLDVKEGDTNPSITPQDVENKMMEGTRDDQRARPRARTPNKVLRLAADLGVDIAHVEGTGENGQITEADVQKAADDPANRLPEAPVTTDTRRATTGTPRTATGASTDTQRSGTNTTPTTSTTPTSNTSPKSNT